MWGALGTQPGERWQGEQTVLTLAAPHCLALGEGPVAGVCALGHGDRRTGRSTALLGVAAHLGSSCIFEGLSVPASMWSPHSLPPSLWASRRGQRVSALANGTICQSLPPAWLEAPLSLSPSPLSPQPLALKPLSPKAASLSSFLSTHLSSAQSPSPILL